MWWTHKDRADLINNKERLEKLEEIANSFNVVQKSYAVQAGRESGEFWRIFVVDV